jgi:hypothetical protein
MNTLLFCALTAPVADPPERFDTALYSWQYRSTLSAFTLWGSGPGAAYWPGETAYVMGYSPLFGVVTRGERDWSATYPPYPSANFALVFPGTLTPYIAASGPPFPEVNGSGRYSLDFEIRDAAGRVGSALLVGNFSAGWSGEGGYAYPDLETASAAIWLGRTRYDVQLHYGSGGPFYQQDADGNWYPAWFASDPIPYQNGGYWSENSGSFYAEITPVAAPEPGTLALAGVGLCGLLAVRRVRRTAT